MAIRFRPPRDVPDLGLTPGQQERFNAWLRAALTEIGEDLQALSSEDSPTRVEQETIDVPEGALRRVTPPSSGMAARIPAPSPTNVGATIRFLIEAPVGALTIVCRPGKGDDGRTFAPTINGERTATFTAAGLVELTSNGANDWKTTSQFASEAAASSASASSSAALNAEYILGSPDALLPNSRVADDSDEIDIDNTSAGLLSWFLKTASVVFAKLQDMTGMSVLGRAANSAGVMAAITAGSARHALMSNSAGTAIAFRAIEAADVPAHTWEEVLAAGNTSGASNPTISAGQRLIVPGGQSAGDGDINSASDLTLHAATDIHLHADGNIHVGHAGSATDVHVEGEQIDIATDVGAVTISASTTANISATASSTIQTGTFFAVNATGDITMTSGDAASLTGSTSVLVTGAGNGLSASAAAFAMAAGTTSVFAFTNAAMSFRTAGTTRLTIGAAGGWTVNSSEGTAGQYLRSSGAAATPTWATIDVSEVAGAQPALTAGDGIDIASDVVSVDVSDLVGTGLEDDGSNNLRIAAAAAGAGLTGGGGSALAVGAGAGITVNANDVAWSGFSLSINGTPASSGWLGFDLIDSAHISWTLTSPGSGLLGLSPTLDTADAYTWTGIHRHDTYVTFGDPGAISTGDIRKNSQLDIIAGGIRLGTLAGGGELDLGTGSTGEAELGGENVILRSDLAVRVVSGTSGTSMGHLVMIGGSSGNTPPAGEGEYWVDDTTAAQTLPGFTDDDDVDHTIGYAFTRVQSNSSTGALGTIALNDNTTVFRWGGGAGAATIAGFSGRLWDGRRLLVRNVDGTNANPGDTLTLLPDSAATATNGIHLAGVNASNDASRNKVIRMRGSIMLTYDGTSSRWYAEAI